MAQPILAQIEMLQGDSSFFPATMHSLAVILITEIGDKTFFIAAVLAMRYGRIFVYAGAMLALAAMHILSVLMGFALPNLLPKSYTHFASAVLFVYFGFKLLKDAYDMEGTGPSEELHEVEEELIKKKEGDSNTLNDLESQPTSPISSNEFQRKKIDSDSNSRDSSGGGGDGSKVTRMKNPTTSENIRVFSQALTLTFLAEWGDRSQIATIALAASKNPFGVIVGGLIGHAFCTGLAVIGGRMLAARISEKHVATVGGILFLLFGIHAFYFGPETNTAI